MLSSLMWMRLITLHENYIRRIEIVQDYIEEHMEEELKIVTLAKVAGFSEYHFSRIFVGVLGENIAQYVKRIRMSLIFQKDE